MANVIIIIGLVCLCIAAGIVIIRRKGCAGCPHNCPGCDKDRR